MGRHAKLVTESLEINAALERSFNSGKTSALNVIPDENVILPIQQGWIDYYRKLAGERLR